MRGTERERETHLMGTPANSDHGKVVFNPPPLFFFFADKDRLDLDEDSLGVCPMRSGSGIGGALANGGGGGSGGGNFNQFLGPFLWDRNLPADGGLFQLQYMDLEEFLTENGMGSMHSNNSSSSAQIPSQSSQSAVPSQSSQCLPPSPPPGSASSSSSSSSSPSLIGLEVAQSQGLAGGSDCLHGELDLSGPFCSCLNRPTFEVRSSFIKVRCCQSQAETHKLFLDTRLALILL